MTKSTLIIQSSKREHVFVALIHTATTPEEFFLDPDEFYMKWGKTIPEGTHHEIEIVQPGEEFFELNQLHVHRSRKSKRPFICYPLAIPTMQKALELFKIWCFGTAGTVDFGVDLNTIFSGECEDNAWKFFILMWERYRIQLIDGKLEESA